jgi:nitrile hydratase subunit beta
MKGYHDIGGTPAGPIPQDEHELQLWEKRVEALLVLLTRKKVLRVDENRRGLESLGGEVYHSLSYAERRMAAISNNLILKGAITVEELAAKIAEIEARPETLP